MPAEPAGDVFSLGCLLAYAATGRLPFGTGAAEAVLYRTVHDEPEFGPEVLADPELAALLRRALAKHPEERPTAREVDGALTEDAPGAGTGWLPDPVVAVIAERAAALLALPGIEETVAEAAPGAAAGGGRGPTRRRLLALGAAGALATVGGGAAAWLSLRGGSGASGAAGGRRWLLGVHADLSGPHKAAGLAQERGVRLAVADFNSRARRPFTLGVVTADDGGAADRSAAAAAELVGNRDVLAVVGPTANASVMACLEPYGEAALPVLTVSALGTSFGVADRRSFFQNSALSLGQGSAVGLQLVRGQGARRLGLLCDRDGDSEGWQAVLLLSRTLGSADPAATAYARVVPRGAQALPQVVADMLAHGVDGFFYTGTPAGAAKTAGLLADAGFRGPRAADYGIAGQEFLAQAGAAAEGWQFLTPYTGPEAPRTAQLAKAHRDAYGEAPGIWTVEAYDTAAQVIDRLAAAAAARGGARPTRAELLAALPGGTYQGLAKEYAYDEQRQVKGNIYFLHRVEGGRIRFVGPAVRESAG
ncbi:ABC transporter substrate-binding protein [Streptomyces sp. CS62]